MYLVEWTRLIGEQIVIGRLSFDTIEDARIAMIAIAQSNMVIDAYVVDPTSYSTLHGMTGKHPNA